MRYRLRTLLILMVILPPVLAAVYCAPSLTFAFLIIGGSAAFAVARRLLANLPI